MIITVEQLLNWGACHHESTLRRWVGDGVTPLQVADCRHLSRGITVRDRLWVLLRPEIIPERELRLLACRWARRTLRRERRAGREPDPRSWAAVEVSERFARGEATRKELYDARDDAGEAARDARAARAAAEYAADAAWEATLATAWYAARAAWYAARAAGASARDAAGYAAREAERRCQLAEVRVAIRRLA